MYWLYVPLRFDDYAIVIIVQEDADGHRSLNEASRIWPASSGRQAEQLGWPRIEIQYRSGTRIPEAAVIHLTEPNGKPLDIEIDSLGLDLAELRTRLRRRSRVAARHVEGPRLGQRLEPGLQRSGGVPGAYRTACSTTWPGRAAMATRATACSSTGSSGATRHTASPTSSRWPREPQLRPAPEPKGGPVGSPPGGADLRRTSRDLEQLRFALQGWLLGRMPAEASHLQIPQLTTSAATGMSSETVLFPADLARHRRPRSHRGPGLPDRAALRSDVPVFPTYDMRGQFEAIRLVGELTSVPVPNVRWLEQDTALLGTPFFLMDRVDGSAAAGQPALHVRQQLAGRRDRRAAPHDAAVDHRRPRGVARHRRRAGAFRLPVHPG